ncbi:MAG: hypothetical protein QOE77_3145 [Blastocatellia bacterium]|jgi:DNA-directed RNA polymerase specialized sigma24 family protein|nr:hypothetical protein [Blastocatellia bacterium]
MNNSDERLYQQFLDGCLNNSLADSDPVVRLVGAKAQKASAWGWGDWTDDLKQETLIQLAKGNYRGDGPLEGYISRIMGNFITRLWRKEHKDRWSEMPVDLKESGDFAEGIESRLSDRTKRLIARSPKHLWWFIEAIVDADGYLSEQDAAKIGKVTRYRVGKLKEELRRIWEKMEEEKELTDLVKAKGAGD